MSAVEGTLEQVIASYDPSRPLDAAWTIPASWYVDPRVARLERDTVFSRSWQMIGRSDQVALPGAFVTAEIAGEPVVCVRGNDGVLRAFFNVCRHHAAAVETRPEGTTHLLRCPYHGWTYSLAGRAERHARLQGCLRFRSLGERTRPGLRGRVGGFRFRAARAGGPAAHRVSPAARRAVPPVESRRVALRRAAALRVRLQLESLRRQLPRRRIPRSASPSRPRQRSGLRQLPDREWGALLPAVESRGRRRRGGADRGRPHRRTRPLLLDLPELHGELV